MEEQNVSFFDSLTFKFLASTAVFIILIEAVLLVMSLYGMETRITKIQRIMTENVIDQVGGDIVPGHFLPPAQYEALLKQYAYNIVQMVLAIIVLVLTGIYFLLKYWILKPIQLIIEKNDVEEHDRPKLISEDNIPSDEIGLIMKSRNKMLLTLDELISEEVMETLVNAVDAKDEYTRGHSQRVGLLGKEIARELGYDRPKRESINYSGTLHDIGKIGLPDEILLKEGSLTDDEFEQIKEHPVKGAEIIQYSQFGDEILGGIRHHHEQYDGTGYPDGLEGDDIPLFGRILGVSDAMDAMLSNRQYRSALSIDVVREELRENKGTQFDPDFAEIGLLFLKPERWKEFPDPLRKLFAEAE